MKVDLKRNIKKFKETTTVYFKRNYYFISQKYILKEINNIVLKKFIECYRLKLDNIVKTLLENNNNNNININLQNCFLEKLKKFALENKINIDIKLRNSSRNIDNNEDFDNRENLKEPPPLLKRNNSIDIINQFDIDPNDYNENNDEPQPKEEVNWFIYKKNKWKYLNKETETSLKKFLENNMIYQETYFKQINNENDKIFKMMKEYEKKQLVNFFNKHYKAFIKDKICKVYNSKNLLVDRTIISDIISGQIFEEIYLYKLNNIANEIKGDLTFCKIKYLTIIVIGRTGAGKSTLINSVLKVEKAETGTGNIVTKENKLYSSDSIPFLRLIDTRGIELKSEFGPEKIFDNSINVINNSEKKKDFNDFVNCIWYCVSDIYIEDNEIEIIRKLRNQKKNIPIIIVYSHALIQECFNNIHDKIKENFPDAIIIPVLAKQADDKNSFGLNELVDKSIEACKNVIINGKIFKSMKERITKKILN
jgi:energy-coupling factor transporter ATP-binding protein EcfA2